LPFPFSRKIIRRFRSHIHLTVQYYIRAVRNARTIFLSTAVDWRNRCAFAAEPEVLAGRVGDGIGVSVSPAVIVHPPAHCGTYHRHRLVIGIERPVYRREPSFFSKKRRFYSAASHPLISANPPLPSADHPLPSAVHPPPSAGHPPPSGSRRRFGMNGASLRRGASPLIPRPSPLRGQGKRAGRYRPGRAVIKSLNIPAPRFAGKGRLGIFLFRKPDSPRNHRGSNRKSVEYGRLHLQPIGALGQPCGLLFSIFLLLLPRILLTFFLIHRRILQIRFVLVYRRRGPLPIA
jgi:hypothetical protein